MLPHSKRRPRQWVRQKKGDTRSHRHAKESAEYSPTTKPCSCDLMHVSPTSPCPSMEAKTSQYSHASTERRRECRHFPFLGHDSSWLGSGPFSFSVSWCIPLLLPRAILLWIQIPWTLLFAFACLSCLCHSATWQVGTQCMHRFRSWLCMHTSSKHESPLTPLNPGFYMHIYSLKGKRKKERRASSKVNSV